MSQSSKILLAQHHQFEQLVLKRQEGRYGKRPYYPREARNPILMTGNYGKPDTVYTRELTPGPTRDERKIQVKPGYQELRRKRAAGEMKEPINEVGISSKLSYVDWKPSIKTRGNIGKSVECLPKSAQDLFSTDMDMPLKPNIQKNFQRKTTIYNRTQGEEYNTHIHSQKRHYSTKGPLTTSDDFTNFRAECYESNQILLKQTKERPEVTRYERNNTLNDDTM